jgi:spermidine/putrescine transport system permease protein
MSARLQRTALLLPAMLTIGLVLVAPLCLIGYVSTLQRNDYGGVLWGHHTAEAYVQFLFERDLDDRLVINSDYLRIILRSIGLAALTSLITFVLAFPTALWMALQPPSRRTLLLFVITVPFWTNLLVRNYAWVLILKNGGVLDWLAHRLGATVSLDLLYTPTATLIGLVYSFMPYMVLPIYVSMEKMDRRYVEAAFDLGADRLQVVRRIIFPLALPGVVGGLILVFIPGLGAFVSPELLGGAKSMMVGSLIQQQFGQARNWPFGSALAFVLLALILLSLWLRALRFRSRTSAAP